MQIRNHDPRPPINQGIDTNNAMVLQHTAIYNGALSTITEGMQTVGLMVNPYGTAPLSGYLGIWSPTSNPIRVQLTNDIGAIPVDYSYTPEPGANLVPLLGLVPAALNHLLVTIPSVGTATGEIITGALPMSDEMIPNYPEGERFIGFPVCELTSPAVNVPAQLEELYFISINSRCNVGLDHNGTVRWFTTLDIPSFNMERVHNNHFMACDLDAAFHNMQRMYEFDMVGRVHTIYVFDNRYHHSIWQMPDGNIMIPSENTGTTMEDGVAIMDINTGLEIAYYDFRESMDTTRRALPSAEAEDWLHVNQCYLNQTNHLIISSSRHQSAVFGIDADTSELAFILANHQDWSEEFQQYLLTPVDVDGNPLYDLTNPENIDRADKEFWNWGQHAVTEVSNSTPGIVEFTILDNGNFRSRDESLAIIPNDNASRMVHYYIDLNQMTVRMVMEYGKTEVGSRGYSAFVSNAYRLDNENYLINFGGIVVDENGRRRAGTAFPELADIVDPLVGEQAEGMVILQEITPDTHEVQVEFTLRSGRLKNPGEGNIIYQEFYSFRARKLFLLP